MTPPRPIRPTPAELRSLPTLDVLTIDQWSEHAREHAAQLGIEPRLELKLQTPGEKYWLCTRGETGPNPGLVQGWIVGNITIEFSDGETLVYVSEDIGEAQKRDYLRLITRDIERLSDAYEKDPTNETWKQLAEARAEFRKLLPPYINLDGLDD